MMKKVLLSAVAALTLSGSAFAADLPVKAKPVAAPPPPAWDVAFGSWLASDYVFRGVSQSNQRPAVSAYFEPRYNINPNLQIYAGVAGSSISFPNRAAAEIDFYAGIRPTFGPLALDFGVFYYWYPGGQCYHGNAAFCVPTQTIPNGNVIKKDLSFVEGYARGVYTINDQFALGFNYFGGPSFLNSGAPGHYLSGTVKYTAPTFPSGIGVYVSGEFGYQWLGTSDSFYSIAGVPGAIGIDYKDYATWNAGIGFTYKVFALDLRYIDTNLSKGDCNALTSDHTAGQVGNVTPINPGGFGSSWCGARFVARLSADLTLAQIK